MRVLLDTHAFLWFVEGSSRLPLVARTHIEDKGNDLLLSVASVWEAAIKASLGKLEISQPFPQFVEGHLALTSIGLLEITPKHVYALAGLPFYHRDPFDRLLAAQCLQEELPIVSADSVFERYGIQRIW